MQDDPLHMSEQRDQSNTTSSQSSNQNRAPMPAWLRAELGDDDQEPLDEAGDSQQPAAPHEQLFDEKNAPLLRLEENNQDLLELAPYDYVGTPDDENILSAYQSGYPGQPTHNRAPMPAWLRAEVGIDNQQSAISTSSQRQVQEMIQLRAEVDLYRAEVARYRRQASTSQTPSHPTRTSSRTTQIPVQAQERGGCLTAWLVVQSIGIVLSVCSIFLLAAIGRNIGYALALMLLLVFAAVSINGLWNLKKWGYYLQMTLCTVSLAFSIMSMYAASSSSVGGASPTPAYSVGSVLGLLAYMVILYLLVHERWEKFE